MEYRRGCGSAEISITWDAAYHSSRAMPFFCCNVARNCQEWPITLNPAIGVCRLRGFLGPNYDFSHLKIHPNFAAAGLPAPSLLHQTAAGKHHKHREFLEGMHVAENSHAPNHMIPRGGTQQAFSYMGVLSVKLGSLAMCLRGHRGNVSLVSLLFVWRLLIGGASSVKGWMCSCERDDRLYIL